MPKTSAAVAICDNQQSVQEAISTLGRAGCSLKKVSVLGRDCYGPDQPLPESADIQLPKQYTKSVSLWYRLWGTLSGDAFLNVTGIGPVLVVGPLAPELIRRWIDPAVPTGSDPLGTGLNGMGVPPKSISACKAALRSDRYVVVLCGNSNEVSRARKVLKSVIGGRPRRSLSTV